MRSFLPQDNRETLLRLEHNGYVDDIRLCHSLLKTMLQKKRYSLSYITHYLLHRGIDYDCIQTELTNLEVNKDEVELDAALSLLQKKCHWKKKRTTGTGQ